jgi:hypothetical protein
MSVLIEAFNVVVRSATIDARYPGGRHCHARDSPNSAICSDEHLTRVGFYHPGDLDSYVKSLVDRGILVIVRGRDRDFSIVSQVSGFDAPCDWLRLGRHPSGVLVAWMNGFDPGPVVVPQGWTMSARPQYVPHIEASKLQWIGMRGNVDIYMNVDTKELCYVGRTQAPERGRAVERQRKGVRNRKQRFLTPLACSGTENNGS